MESRNSKILEIIELHQDWKNYFQENYPDINIVENGNFAIFNYRSLSNFDDPIVKEARGIIIDTFKLKVACFPFTKFGKYDDYYADEIDWKTAHVQEKIDGSIIKMWFNEYSGKWQFSTNSTIDARTTYTPDETTFYDIIKSTDEYEIIQNHIDIFNKEITYVFELVSKHNRVVLKYYKSKLFLTGIRNNRTGEEYSTSILSNILPTPLEYPLSSLDECINYVTNIMNKDDGKLVCNHEGFVVVDNNWNRIKIKSPIYMLLHTIADDTKRNRIFLCNYIYNESLNTSELMKDYRSSMHIFKFYEYQISEYLYNIHAIIDIARRMYSILNDRKKVAKLISKHKYSAFGFAAINNPDMNDDEILKYCANKYDSIGAFIEARIPHYEKLSDNSNVWDGFYDALNS